ncbi:MAG: glycerate kinase [Nocardioides sp.]|nr:glycerate kinase [Nocardioides sp.]
MSAPCVLVAPDSVKGTMTAAQVAAALAAGVRAAGGTAVERPLADGGEGTLAVLSAVYGGRTVEREVTAPDGRRVRAGFVLDEDTRVAVVETAAASGLHLVDPDTVDAYAATSAGTGELLVAAVECGAREVLLGVGGSGCSDGGLGALRAIDDVGGLGGARLTVLCDVLTPYEESARLFGPQKGADPATVERLTRRLHKTAGRLPRDPRGVPRTGAAGGLSGALWAAHDATLVQGIDTVLDRLRFSDLLAGADLALTGEGRLDGQTEHGKVVDGVTRWAARAGVPVVAVVGRNDADPDLLDRLGLVDAVEAGDPDALAAAAADLTTTYLHPDPSRSKEVTAP